MQDRALKLANELDAGDNFYAESSLYYDTNLSNAVSESAAMLRTQCAELQQWKNVFGHLGTADECGNEWIRLQDENQRLREALIEVEGRLTLLIDRGQHKLLDVAARDKVLAALEK